MDAVALALASAALFGAMTVAFRLALARGADADRGALWTIAPALAVALAFTAMRSDWALGGVWPFLLAGLLGPGISQLLFTFAVRDAGPSSTSVVVGTAPLFSVAIALVFLDEPLVAGVLAGAVLIVAGGAPARRASATGRSTFGGSGSLLALAATVVFAVRDNFVRWLSIDTDVDPALAAIATLAAGGFVVLVYMLPGGAARLRRRCLRPGRNSRSGFRTSACSRPTTAAASPSSRRSSRRSRSGASPLRRLLRQRQGCRPHLVAGAALIVAGGVLIGVFR